MPPKRRRRKATLHSAGKVTEADLLERARALAEDPSLAMPICDGPCGLFSPVKAARRAIPKIHAARDDERKLSRYASWGNELAKAYAATLLVARAEKIPYVAELRLPTGSIPYVIRGKAKPFFLAGLQNHHDRHERLVAYFPWARKRRLHFFSADRGVVCTGRNPKPPEDFVQEEMDELDLAEKAPGVFACGHAGAGPGRDALVLRWATAGVTLERCSDCVGKESTLMTLMRHMAGPNLLKGFQVQVHLAPLVSPDGKTTPVVPPLPAETLEAYLKGVASDAVLMEAAREGRAAAFQALGRRFYAAGERSFGDDAKALLAALGPSAAEERALRAGLERDEGALVLDKPTVARALAALWPRHGLAMLEAAAGGDAEAARRLHKEKVTPEEAADLVRRAGREGNARVAMAGVPRYGALPPAASAADAIARAHRAGNREGALRVAQAHAGTPEGRAVALAFLHALGAAKGQEWRFTADEQEAAKGLAPHVKALLEGAPGGYHAALVEVSRLSGESATFAPEG